MRPVWSGWGGTWWVHAVSAALLVALSVSWYAGLMHPMATAAARAAERQSQVDAIGEGVRLLADRREGFAAAARKQEKELAESAVHLRPPTFLNTRLAEITRLAEANALRVQSVDPGKPVDSALAVRVPMRFTARGASPVAVRFMADLRRTFPDVSIEGFEVTTESGAQDTILRFDLEWYADRAGDRPTAVPRGP